MPYHILGISWHTQNTSHRDNMARTAMHWMHQVARAPRRHLPRLAAQRTARRGRDGEKNSLWLLEASEGPKHLSQPRAECYTARQQDEREGELTVSRKSQQRRLSIKDLVSLGAGPGLVEQMKPRYRKTTTTTTTTFSSPDPQPSQALKSRHTTSRRLEPRRLPRPEYPG
jgi:hypothetical protein